MPSITLEDAQAPLAAWIAQLRPGEELVIVEKNRPVARLTAEPVSSEKPRRPGSAIGILTIHEDDDSQLEDFKEYMP